MKEVLVTGGTGYIGSHTVVELYEAGFQPVVVDNLSNSRAEVLHRIKTITGFDTPFYQVDCCDTQAMHKLFGQHSFVAAIHFAASKSVSESVEKPLSYYRNNIDALLTLLECMAEKKTPALVFSSSCTVYGEPEKLPVTEASTISPAKSPYGNTKQINEEIIRDFVFGGAAMSAVLLRYFNPIGAHPSALIGEEPRGVPQNLVPYLTQTAAGLRKHLSVFGTDYDTPDGSCIRDYIHIVDLAQAHIAALQFILRTATPSTPQVEAFNIGTGRGVSVLELLHAFEEANNIKVPSQLADRRAGDVKAIWADPSKANATLGWKATTPLHESLRTAWLWQQRILEETKR